MDPAFYPAFRVEDTTVLEQFESGQLFTKFLENRQV